MLTLVTGIDTGIGKTVAVGLLGKFWRQRGRTVLTGKLVQTGCSDDSEDVRAHRRWMGQVWTNADRDGETCPYCFDFPGSPHLAARLEGTPIDPAVLDTAVAAMRQRAEIVILEGAGGICVPLTEDLLLSDYLAERRWPCVVVTSPRLGSINHTCLTVDTLQTRGIPVSGLIYNLYGDTPPEITDDTRRFFLHRYPHLPVVDLPPVAPASSPPVDFSPLFTASSV